MLPNAVMAALKLAFSVQSALLAGLVTTHLVCKHNQICYLLPKSSTGFNKQEFDFVASKLVLKLHEVSPTNKNVHIKKIPLDNNILTHKTVFEE